MNNESKKTADTTTSETPKIEILASRQSGAWIWYRTSHIAARRVRHFPKKSLAQDRLYGRKWVRGAIACGEKS